MTTQFRCIGKGTTDASGVAHLTHDCSGNQLQTAGYVGTGAGKIDIVASLDDPNSISESSFLTKTYVLIDGTFVDRGTSDSYGRWDVWSSYPPKLVRNSEYCQMTVDTGKTDARMYKIFNPSDNVVGIEFDAKVVTTSNTYVWATIRNADSNVLGNFDMVRFENYGGSINEWHHFKLIITPTTVSVNIDNNNNTYTYNSGGVTRFYFQIKSGEISELDYKNFVIYPI